VTEAEHIVKVENEAEGDVEVKKALAKARKYVEAGKAARDAGDRSGYLRIQREVAADQVMRELLEVNGMRTQILEELPEEEGEEAQADQEVTTDFRRFKAALYEFAQLMKRTLALAKKNLNGRDSNIVVSVFYGEEVEKVASRLTTLVVSVEEAKTPDDIDSTFSDFYSYFTDKLEPVVAKRFKAMHDYVGGQLSESGQNEFNLLREASTQLADLQVFFNRSR
jgi:hypothetical protein